MAEIIFIFLKHIILFWVIFSSWISLVIGFSSPVSLAALAMAKYMSVFQGDFGTFFAIVVILLVALALSF